MGSKVKAFMSEKAGGFDARWRAVDRDSAALSSVMRYTTTKDGRAYYDGGELVAKGRTFEECASKAAEREARAILAVSEPTGRGAGYHDAPSWTWDAFGAKSSLAESLAAFVGMSL